MSRLNESQKQAVETTEGPLLLIAGPGSGKTMTLVNRIVHLLVDKQIPPERILVSTFTRKASLELQSRLLKELDKRGVSIQVQDMLIGTLHSIFLKLIERYRSLTQLRKGFRLLDELDQNYLIYRNLDKFLEIDNAIHLTLKDYSSQDPTPISRTTELLKWINKVNEEMLDVQQLLNSNDVPIRALGQAYLLYEDLLAKENAMDFGLIQITLLRLLRSHPDVLDELRHSISYLMIDEYQDTNTIQEHLILQLAGKHRNLCVVGDDDQSIYRFRGATVQNLLKFDEHFEPDECRVIKLEVNYRSHPRIINFYRKWMEQCNWSDGYGGSYRKEKIITPAKEDNGKTSRVIRLTSSRNERKWYEEVHQFLTYLMEEGIISNWNQVAFLFRSVKSPEVKRLAEYLESREIPVFAPRTGAFFNRDEVQFVIGALLLATQTVHSPNLLSPYLKGCADRVRQQLQDPVNHTLVWWIKNKRAAFLKQKIEPHFTAMFYELLAFPLINQYMSVEYIGSAREGRRVRNLAALTKWFVRFEQRFSPVNVSLQEQVSEFFEFLSYMQENGQHEYEDESDYAPSGAVSFFTFHQSKGLEFPIVVVGSLESMPWQEQSWIEESLRHFYPRKPYEPLSQTSEYDLYRLFYTAFSRAEELLVLTGNEQGPDFRGRNQLPSELFEPLYHRLSLWSDPHVHLQELRVHDIKPTTLHQSYAYTSDVVRYRSCPRQYLLERHFGFESESRDVTRLGTLIHYVLEDVHQMIMQGKKVAEEEVWKLIQEYSHELNALAEEVDTELADTAFTHIKRYLTNILDQSITIEAAEQPISGFLGSFLLNGKIDAVITENGCSVLLDFKTGVKPLEKDGLESYRQQIMLYAFLFQQRTGRKVEEVRLIFTGETEEEMIVTFHVEEAALRIVLEDIENILINIDSNLFDIKKMDPLICRYCSFKHFCLDSVIGSNELSQSN